MSEVGRCSYAAIPAVEVLRDVLEYDCETGFLHWRTRPRHLFASDGAHAAWNTRHAGKLALHTRRPDGYRDGAIFYKRFLAHRVVWKIAHGVEPFEIDHIDGDRLNNRIDNLRNVSPQGNARNLKKIVTNSSGTMGVARSANGKRWVARIGLRGSSVHIGTFDSQEDAIAARHKAAQTLGFSEMHGVRS